MKRTVFWSWQSDLMPAITKNFIRNALIQALKNVEKDLELEMADRIELDHDTKGEAGLVEIVTTIFNKIDECEVFIADITPIAEIVTKGEVKKIPNPNVMIELGYALRELGHQRVITVANLNFGGKPEELPFDLRHRRGAITYNLSESDANRDQVRKDLIMQLTEALALNLKAIRYDKTYKNPRPILLLDFDENAFEPFPVPQNIASREILSLDEIKEKTRIRHENEQKEDNLLTSKVFRRPSLFGYDQSYKDFQDWTLDEINGYNLQVSSYYANYEKYIEEYNEYKLNFQRTFIVKINIVNNGVKPATDIRSKLTFPSGVFIYEKDRLPEPPKEPNPPPFAPYGRTTRLQIIHDNSIGALAPQKKRIANDHKSINFEVDKLQHGYLKSLKEFVIMFSSQDDMKLFEAKYYITADELPQPVEEVILFDCN